MVQPSFSTLIRKTQKPGNGRIHSPGIRRGKIGNPEKARGGPSVSIPTEVIGNTQHSPESCALCVLYDSFQFACRASLLAVRSSTRRRLSSSRWARLRSRSAVASANCARSAASSAYVSTSRLIIRRDRPCSSSSSLFLRHGSAPLHILLLFRFGYDGGRESFYAEILKALTSRPTSTTESTGPIGEIH